MTKPTDAEIVDVLNKSGNPDCIAMAARMEAKRPKHRPANPTAPYNRAALLDVFFSFLKNAEDVDRLRGGVMPAGLSFEPEYADELIARLSPVAADGVIDAMRMAVDWFGKHGVIVSINTLKKAYYDYAQRVGSIETSADWERFKQSQRDEIHNPK